MWDDCLISCCNEINWWLLGPLIQRKYSFIPTSQQHLAGLHTVNFHAYNYHLHRSSTDSTTQDASAEAGGTI